MPPLPLPGEEVGIPHAVMVARVSLMDMDEALTGWVSILCCCCW